MTPEAEARPLTGASPIGSRDSATGAESAAREIVSYDRKTGEIRRRKATGAKARERHASQPPDMAIPFWQTRRKAGTQSQEAKADAKSRYLDGAVAKLVRPPEIFYLL